MRGLLLMLVALAYLCAGRADAQIVQPLDPTWLSGNTGGKGVLVVKNGQGVLGSLRGANFATTADQAISVCPPSRRFRFNPSWSRIARPPWEGRWGGVYPAVSKGGTPIVAASQSYGALFTGTALLPLTISTTGLATRYAQPSIWLSLTTPYPHPAICDVYLIGIDLT